jgi:hypothetical protein
LVITEGRGSTTNYDCPLVHPNIKGKFWKDKK